MDAVIGLLQRVSQARVTVAGAEIAAIGRGLVVLVGVERGDTQAQAERLAARLLGYRVFAAADGRLDASVAAIGGALLLVPQFTLAADTGKGTRASFTPAADPATGEQRFGELVAAVTTQGSCPVATGRFGADMQVSLTNDGPVTFCLRAPPPA